MAMLLSTPAATADACATVSGMSLGPWQTPATEMPPRSVSVGSEL